MKTSTQTVSRRLVREDLTTIRSILEKVKQTDRLAPLHLLGRRKAAAMLEYMDQRSSSRDSVRVPVFLTQTTYDGTYVEIPECESEARLCITKDVSMSGIGFTHDDLLDADYAIVTFDLLDAYASLLLEIKWKNIETDRFSLMSGGRFIGILD